MTAKRAHESNHLPGEFHRDPADPRPALAQWEDVVSAAGRLGLRLIVDLVLNHVGILSNGPPGLAGMPFI